MTKWYKVFKTVHDAKERLKVNEMVLVVAGSRKVCLARTEEGFMAIGDHCPHMGESLHNGHINYLGEVICPLHSYRYSLKTGSECSNRTKSAQVYPVKINENGLHVGVEENPENN